jgi:hypothetical protein
MMLLGHKLLGIYIRMPQKCFPEIPIKILELKIIFENHEKISEKLHVFLACLLTAINHVKQN